MPCNLLCTRGSSQGALSRKGSGNKTPFLVSLGMFPPQKTMEALVYCVRALELSKREIIHTNGPIQLMLSFFFFFNSQSMHLFEEIRQSESFKLAFIGLLNFPIAP